jgi:hypothetical protein
VNILSEILIETVSEAEKFPSTGTFCGTCDEPDTSHTSSFDQSRTSLKRLLDTTVDVVVEYLVCLSNCLEEDHASIQLHTVKAFFVGQLSKFCDAVEERTVVVKQTLDFEKAVARARKTCPLLQHVRLPAEDALFLGRLHLAAVVIKLQDALVARRGGVAGAVAFLSLLNEVRTAKHAFFPPERVFEEFNDGDNAELEAEKSVMASNVTVIESCEEPVDEVHVGEGTKADDLSQSPDVTAEEVYQARRDVLLLAELRPLLERIKDEWESREKVVKVEEPPPPPPLRLGIVSSLNQEETFGGSDTDDEEEAARDGPDSVNFNVVAGQMAGFAPILEGIVGRMSETVFGSSDEDSDEDDA